MAGQETLTEQETRDAADAAMTAGYALLGARPSILAALDRAAQHAARGAADMGDVSAETLSYATELLARVAADGGLPASDDDAAALVVTLARNAARRAREDQRGRWTPRIRETRPSDAPNRMERWNTASLIAHAEQYTMGALATREQASAVLDAHAVYAWPMVTRTALVTRSTPRRANGDHVSRDARGALVGPDATHAERVTAAETVSGGLCAPRHSGQTSPATESTWARERDAVRLRAAMGAAMGAATVDAVSDAYRPERVRRIGGRGKRVGDVLRTRRVSWARVAAGTGRDRGTVRRETMRDAGRVSALVSRGARADHAAGRAWCALDR